MPAQSSPLGIKSISLTLAQKFELEKKLTMAPPLLDKDGKFVQGDARDPVFTFSMEGKGDLPDGLVAGTNGGDGAAVSGIEAGKTIIKDVEESQKTDGWNEWKASGENYPSAS